MAVCLRVLWSHWPWHRRPRPPSGRRRSSPSAKYPGQSPSRNHRNATRTNEDAVTCTWHRHHLSRIRYSGTDTDVGCQHPGYKMDTLELSPFPQTAAVLGLIETSSPDTKPRLDWLAHTEIANHAPMHTLNNRKTAAPEQLLPKFRKHCRCRPAPSHDTFCNLLRSRMGKNLR